MPKKSAEELSCCADALRATFNTLMNEIGSSAPRLDPMMHYYLMWTVATTIYTARRNLAMNGPDHGEDSSIVTDRLHNEYVELWF
jgi:hypothetical protein